MQPVITSKAIMTLQSFLGSIQLSTKPQKDIVHKTEAYGGKWQINEGTLTVF